MRLEGQLFLGVFVEIGLHIPKAPQDRVVVLTDVGLHLRGLIEL